MTNKKKKTSSLQDNQYYGKFQIQPKWNASKDTYERSYPNFVANDNKDAPASLILRDPNRLNETFIVKGANGRDYALCAAWIIGFTDGEGTLTFHLNKNKEMTAGFQVQAVYELVQGEPDYYLLTAIAEFFGCGTVSQNKADKTSVRYIYRVADTRKLATLFVPFLKLARLNTRKGLSMKSGQSM